jgi:hypothetical protein
MDRQTALLELAPAHAVALRLHDAGEPDEAIAVALGIPVSSVAEAIGLGLSVPLGADAGRVRAAERLLGDPSYRAAGATARSGLERLPSVDDGVRLVERLGG